MHGESVNFETFLRPESENDEEEDFRSEDGTGREQAANCSKSRGGCVKIFRVASREETR